MQAQLYSGPVRRGFQRGRTINFPTANIQIAAGLPEPEQGVYAAWCCLDGEVYRAVVSYGRNPTFQNEAPTLEAHLLHVFEREFYGQPLLVCLAQRLRGMRRFSGLLELRENISLDVEHAVHYFDENPIAEADVKGMLQRAWRDRSDENTREAANGLIQTEARAQGRIGR